MQQIQDVMTERVVVARASTPFKELARLMWEHQVSALPVVDDHDRLVGIVSEEDLLSKRTADRRPRLFERSRTRLERAKARGRMAGDVMSSPVVTIGPTATVTLAARMMRDRGVKRLPVVDDDGHVVGIVSRTDLLSVFVRPDRALEAAVREALAGDLRWIEPGSVGITVRDGIATLTGEVESRSQIPVLVGIARSVEGVVGVDSQLGYKVDDVTEGLQVLTPWGPFVRL